MLSPFAHLVPCCCYLLGVVAQILKLVKLLALRKRTRNNSQQRFVRLHLAQGLTVCSKWIDVILTLISNIFVVGY